MTRRCRSCHQPTHPKGHLPAGCLVDELTHHHAEGHAQGPGLYVQLVHALGDPRRKDPGAPSAHQKPGSRPPGWRADISDLLAAMRTGGIGHRSDGWLEANVSHGDLEQWVLEARQCLGFVTPSRLLVDLMCSTPVRNWTPDGWVTLEIGCCKTRIDPATGAVLGDSVRAAEDGATGAWCGNRECHNDDRWPDCRQWFDGNGYPAELGYGEAVASTLSCRRTEKDLRHNFRWTAAELAQRFIDQKLDEVEQEQRELAEMHRVMRRTETPTVQRVA